LHAPFEARPLLAFPLQDDRRVEGSMPQSEKTRERIQMLDERLARLRAEKNRLLARASQTERKRDTRRKILIGGAILAAIDHGGVPALRSKADLLHWIDARLTRPRDRAVFDFVPLERHHAGSDLTPGVMTPRVKLTP
jgi:hypothetical protein